jgi:hypothetical protein
MTDGSLRRLFWRLADHLDYLLTLLRLRILGGPDRPLAGDAGRSAAEARSGAAREGVP